MSRERVRYLQDSEFRRRALLDSLTNVKNVYARTRIASYGLGERGWDRLPEWVPTTQKITQEYVQTLRSGEESFVEDLATPIWDGIAPQTHEKWIALGRRVFFEYPLRSEIFADHALRDAELASRVGLIQNEDGVWPGVIAFSDVDGEPAIGITCALCHVSIEDGQMVEGRARRSFDYGEMRLAYYRETEATLPEDTARRMAKWGPGRADITQDDEEDPVAIVDLWGLIDHGHFTQSGTLRHSHPAALAIRQETQIIHANEERIRPPRELSWALAMYLYSLKPPLREPLQPSASLVRGQSIFSEHCSHCHSDRNYSGPLVPVDSVGTDGALARGSARGTGLYRPSPLISVAQAAPYLHDGSVGSLPQLLDTQRQVPGHRFGTSLSAPDKLALIEFLETL